jgi:hypothetical protein
MEITSEFKAVNDNLASWFCFNKNAPFAGESDKIGKFLETVPNV